MNAADKNTCPVCKGTTFYKESGYFYCTQCLTQNEDINEQVYEANYDATTRFTARKIRTEKNEEKDVIGWTSWELYNFVILGLANELIEIGADPEIKQTIFQLWTYYLTKLEVAFTSTDQKAIPKMSRQYRKKDAEIIYGKVQKKKKKRRRKSASSNNSSIMSSSILSSGSASRKDFTRSQRLLIKDHNELAKSQQSSDPEANSSMNQSLESLESSFSKSSNNAMRLRFNKRAKLETKKAKEKAKTAPRGLKKYIEKKYVSRAYISTPDVLTHAKIMATIFLALRVHKQNIYLSDILRFGRENHITLYKLHNLIPSEVTLSRDDVVFLTRSSDLSHKNLRKTACKMAHYLDITELPKPDILELIRRYCEDLGLPKGIMLYAEKVYLASPCTMDFKNNSSTIPNYEGRAMAYIIVVLKILFGLDDITEKEISRVVEKINRAALKREILEEELFSFCEWQQFIECRKSILSSVHFPSKVKYDPENMSNPHLYLRFMTSVDSKYSRPVDHARSTHHISAAVADALRQCINDLSSCKNDEKIEPLKEMITFPPSLTPLTSYITDLNENSHIDIPYVLQKKFHNFKVGYMTQPHMLVQLASHCNILLKVVDNSVHYFEKIVPPSKYQPAPKGLTEFVKVETQSDEKSCTEILSDNLLDYVHQNRPFKLKVNTHILRHYSALCGKEPEPKEVSEFEDESFNKVLPDGRLDIKEDSSSESSDENSDDQSKTKNTFALNEDFFKQKKIELYNHELNFLKNPKDHAYKKEKIVSLRGPDGKFVKSSNKKIKKKYNKVVEQSESSDDEPVAKTKPKPRKRMKKKQVQDSSQSQDDDKNEYIDISESDEVSTVEEDVSIVNDSKTEDEDDTEILFRPYKDYWMYYCDYSVSYFELVEKELPRNFLWLLNECANMIETTTEDLYMEVCVVESYHLNILKTDESKDEDKKYPFHDTNSVFFRKHVNKEWL